ncbi:hypothetical protein RDWZM_008095 [Blomia tropicalis]|uniref:Importin subunit alpha n=1 Tax=Blomia tropicalis TaxID=40697 RepID=A0A9Q0RIJ8_BLOTA|nr:hypothetical protein RDWZM_008095 [Blomia tropicalis]
MDLSHSKNYKNQGKDLDDLRRRRNEINVELRKNKRDEVLLKKRNVDIGSDDENNSMVENVNERKITTEELEGIAIASMSPNLEEKSVAVKAIRKLLSADKNPPIDDIIEAGIIPRLVESLSYEQVPALQFEAAWALTNIASGTSAQTKKVVESGAVPLFIQLLYSSNVSVAEQSVWALGNIIGDGAELRDFVLNNGVIEPLIRLFESNSSITFMRNLIWVIVNICRKKNPPPPIEAVKQLLPVLLYLLKHSTDNLILIDVIWTISYISDHGNEQIQLLINSGIIEFVIRWLNHEESKIQTPALRVIGNIATGNDDQTQHILNLGTLSYVPKLLEHPKERIKKETLWFISNITAGRTDQIQMLIDSSIILLTLEYLRNGSYTLQREAAWAISNMTLNGTFEQVKYLVDNNVIEPICHLLIVKDNQIIHILLEALAKILSHYRNDYQLIADSIESCGGLDTIEALQTHENEEIYKFAYEIIDSYFESANEELPDLVPQTDKTEFDFQTSNANLPNQNFKF